MSSKVMFCCVVQGNSSGDSGCYKKGRVSGKIVCYEIGWVVGQREIADGADGADGDWFAACCSGRLDDR